MGGDKHEPNDDLSINDQLIKGNFFIFISEKSYRDKNTYENPWRVPSSNPVPRPQTSPSETTPDKRRAYVIEPLRYVFFDPALLDELAIHTGVQDLLEGSATTEFPGVIAYGPPGTGKSAFLEAICETYTRGGAYAKKISLSQMNSFFVGQFARNIEAEIVAALAGAQRTGLPALLVFDEASSLVQIAEDGSVGVSKHYQEVIDVLKRYAGNDRRLVMVVATNLLFDDFEGALVREGRLTPYLIDLPGVEERKKMWKHFLAKYGWDVLLEDSQYHELAEMVDGRQGAFIEEFCRTYKGRRRKKLYTGKGYESYLDALQGGVNVTDAEIHEVTYETLLADIKEEVEFREKMNGTEKQKHRIGFRAPNNSK